MTTINDVHKKYEKTLHIENFHLIDVPLATYITKDSDGDRIFLIGKGASGSGKTVFTEPLRALSWNPLTPTRNNDNHKYNIFFISRVTPALFASGSSKDNTKDLGHWLQNRASFLIYSDLAPLLTMGEEMRRELFGMFRDLFDGFIKYDTGKTPKHYYNIKVNSMGFATHMIEQSTEINNLMGTREIVYELPDIKQVEQAMIKRDTPEGKEQRINVVKDFLDDIGKVENGLWNFDGDFIDLKRVQKPQNKQEKQINSTLDLIKNKSIEASIERTPAITDDNGLLVRHIKTEFPMRLNNQLIKLYQGLRALGIDNLSSSFYICQISDTCGNSIRTEILEHLWEEETKVKETEVTKEVNEQTGEMYYEGGDAHPKIVHKPIGKNSFQIGYELNISPDEILKQLMILRDMQKVIPVIDVPTESWSSNPFDVKTKWLPLGNFQLKLKP